jgi:hypothetical protein
MTEGDLQGQSRIILRRQPVYTEKHSQYIALLTLLILQPIYVMSLCLVLEQTASYLYSGKHCLLNADKMGL